MGEKESGQALAGLFAEVQDLRQRAVKRARVSLLVVLILIVLVVAGIVYLTYNNYLLSPSEIRSTIARHNLLGRSAEFKLLEYPVRRLSGYIRTKWGEKQQGAGLLNHDFEVLCSVLYIYNRLYDIEPEFAWAIISTESEWDKTRKGKAGEVGLFQLMPSTARAVLRNQLYDISSTVNISDVYYNTTIALEHIRWLRSVLRSELDREPTVREIAWAYNAGQTSAVRAIKTGDTAEHLARSADKYGESVQYYYDQYCKNNYNVYFWESKRADITNINK